VSEYFEDMAGRGYFGWLKFSICRMKVRAVNLYYHIDCFIAPFFCGQGNMQLKNGSLNVAFPW